MRLRRLLLVVALATGLVGWYLQTPVLADGPCAPGSDEYNVGILFCESMEAGMASCTVGVDQTCSVTGSHICVQCTNGYWRVLW